MQQPALRIVFIGTHGEFTLKSLQRILSSRFQVIGIIESAPRGWQSPRPPLKRWVEDLTAPLFGQTSLRGIARQKKLPYLYLCRSNQERLGNFLKELQPDTSVVASMNQLLPQAVLSIPRLGFINLHPSLLPKLRGPFAWFWYYHQMETEIGVTVFQIDAHEDTGDILKQTAYPLPLGLEPDRLIQIASSAGAQVLIDVLNELDKGQTTTRPQRHLPCPQRARHLKAEEDLFPWQNWTLEHVYHFIKGVAPWYRALTGAHGLLGWLPWQVESYQKVQTHPPFGFVRLDRQGAYFNHPEGKIRLQLKFSFIRMILWILFLLAVLNIFLMRAF